MYDRKKLEQMRVSLEKWEANSLQKTLASLPERQEQFITMSSEPVNRLYTSSGCGGIGLRRDLRLPRE